MMDFNLMVRNVLFESETGQLELNLGDTTGTTAAPINPGAENTEEQKEKEIALNLTEYIKSIYPVLQTLWKTQYKIIDFIGEDKIVVVVNEAVYGAGKTQSAGYDKELVKSIFPLYDLIAYLYENYFKNKQKPDTETLKKTYESFEKGVKASPIPLEFVPMSSWGKNVKAELTKLSSDVIGKLQFKNLNENLSFWGAIEELMKLYKIKASFALPSKLNGGWTRAGQQIKTIFSDVNLGRTGKFEFQDETMRVLYDNLSTQLISNLSIALYNLYKREVTIYFSQEGKDPNVVEKLLTNSDKYAEFMGIGGSRALSWDFVDPTKPLPKVETFDQAYELLARELLGEIGMYSPATGRLSTDPGAAAPSGTSSETSATEPKIVLSQFQDEAKTPVAGRSDTGQTTFTYNLKNLRKTTNSQVKEVTAVIQSFEALANRFKTDKSNLMNNINKIKSFTQGLGALGGVEVGQ